MPDTGKLQGEKQFPEELKVGTARQRALSHWPGQQRSRAAYSHSYLCVSLSAPSLQHQRGPHHCVGSNLPSPSSLAISTYHRVLLYSPYFLSLLHISAYLFSFSWGKHKSQLFMFHTVLCTSWVLCKCWLCQISDQLAGSLARGVEDVGQGQEKTKGVGNWNHGTLELEGVLDRRAGNQWYGWESWV